MGSLVVSVLAVILSQLRPLYTYFDKPDGPVGFSTDLSVVNDAKLIDRLTQNRSAI